MQIKTTVKYDLTPVRIVIIEKTRDKKCWWGCEEKKTLILSVRILIGIATMENSMKVPPNLKK